MPWKVLKIFSMYELNCDYFKDAQLITLIEFTQRKNNLIKYYSFVQSEFNYSSKKPQVSMAYSTMNE